MYFESANTTGLGMSLLTQSLQPTSLWHCFLTFLPPWSVFTLGHTLKVALVVQSGQGHSGLPSKHFRECLFAFSSCKIN